MGDYAGCSYFSRIAAEYSRLQPLFVPEYDTVIDMVADLAVLGQPVGFAILDLGCGTGTLLAKVRERRPDARVVGIERSAAMIEVARSRLCSGDSTSLVEADLNTYRLTGSFHAVVSSFAIHHLPDTRKSSLFMEVSQVLKPGGCVWIADTVAFESAVLREWVQHRYSEFIAALVQEGILSGDEVASKRRLKREAKLAGSEVDYRAPLDAQIQWLRQSGLIEIDSVFRWMGRTVFGGFKPGRHQAGEVVNDGSDEHR